MINRIKKMSSDEMARLIWQKGHFLSSRNLSDFKANLFSLSNLFIEIVFDRADQPVSITVLSENDLEHYMNDVQLPNWVGNQN